MAKKAGKWAAKNIGSRAIGSAYNTVYKRLTHNRKPQQRNSYINFISKRPELQQCTCLLYSRNYVSNAVANDIAGNIQNSNHTIQRSVAQLVQSSDDYATMVAIYSDIRYENATVRITPLAIPNISKQSSVQSEQYTTTGLELVGCIDCIDAGNTDTIVPLTPEYILRNRTLQQRIVPFTFNSTVSNTQVGNIKPMTFTWRNDFKDRNAEFFPQSDMNGANAYVNWAACIANATVSTTDPAQYIVECWSKVTFRKIDRI